MKSKGRGEGREEERRDTKSKSASQIKFQISVFSKILLLRLGVIAWLACLAAGSSDEARYQLEVTACPSKWQRNWSVKRQWNSLNTLDSPLMHC